MLRRSFSAGRSLAQLLLVSKTWHDAVKSNCLGCFELVVEAACWYRTSDRDQIIHWISRNGHLLSAICFRWGVNCEGERAAAKQALEDALVTAAAAAPAGLQLQSFQSSNMPLTCSTLRLISPLHITRLETKLCATAIPAISSIISQLISLRSLELRCAHVPLNPVLPALCHLTCLTRLALDKLAPGAALGNIPAQVVDLPSITVQHARAPGKGLVLGHLTALSSLRVHGLSHLDQLPPNLHSLSLSECSTLQPLQGMQQLQVLRIGWCTVPAASLAQLQTMLPAVSYMELEYDTMAAAAASAGAWGQLPALQKLSVFDWTDDPLELPRDAAEQLSQLTALTELELRASEGIPCEAIGELARSLAGLDRLSILRLRLETPGVEQDEVAELALAVAGLTGLQELRLEDVPLGMSAVRLTKLESLSVLSLWDPTLTDLAVTALLQSLTQLDELHLGRCTELRGSFMPVLARLSWLEELYLPGAAVTDATVEFLGSCNSLEIMEVCGECKLSEEGVTRFREAKPGLSINLWL